MRCEPTDQLPAPTRAGRSGGYSALRSGPARWPA